MDLIGCVGGAIAALFIWFNGEPLSLLVICVPVSGFLSGWCFRKFVSIPAEAAGPYADHRPVARGLAFAILFATIVGAAIGFNINPGFVGVSCGLVIGTVAAGTTAFLLSIFSHF